MIITYEIAKEFKRDLKGTLKASGSTRVTALEVCNAMGITPTQAYEFLAACDRFGLAKLTLEV